MKQQTDPRHQARIIAMQTLFEWSFNSTDIKASLERNLADQTNLEESIREFVDIDKELAELIVRGVTDNLDTIDQIIENTAPEWPLEQISKVDLEILRIAIFELYIARSIPSKVAIDEAVELGKEFGGENTSKFVNGVLGAVVKQLMPNVNESQVEDD
jgi:N utilization substance protein B